MPRIREGFQKARLEELRMLVEVAESGSLSAAAKVGFFPGNTNVLSIMSPKGTSKLELRPRVSGNDFFFVREAIVAGLGIGPLPWFVAMHEVAAGRAVRVLPVAATRVP